MIVGSAWLQGFAKRGFSDPGAVRGFADSQPFGDQITCPPELFLCDDGLSAAKATTGLRGVKAGAGPFADQVALELPKRAEGQSLAFDGSIDDAGKSYPGRRLAGQGQSLAESDELHEIVAADTAPLDGWMAAQLGEILYEIVVSFRGGIRLTDDEMLITTAVPTNLRALSQTMRLGEDDEYPFFP